MAVQPFVVIALATVFGALAFEAWADRGTFRGHSLYQPSIRLPDATPRLPNATPRLPDATPRLPAYSPGWGQTGVIVPGHGPKRRSRKSFRNHPHPPYGYYAPAYVAPLVVYPLSEVPETEGYAYFCPDNLRYYPDVRECPSGWLAVVPGAPGPPDASRP